MRNRCVILIDFDNFLDCNNQEINSGVLKNKIMQLILEVLKIDTTVDDFLIRLYGGWNNETSMTNFASQLMQTVASIDLFPIVSHKKNLLIKGEIKLAFELNEVSDFIWMSTYRERSGLPSFRINYEKISNTCESAKEVCPIFILSKFTKSKTKICSTSGCETRHREVFFMKEQKMVDTLIACDLLSFCEGDEFSSIMLVSDDTDHFPAIVMGSKRLKSQKNIILTLRNRALHETVESKMDYFKIKTCLYNEN